MMRRSQWEEYFRLSIELSRGRKVGKRVWLGERKAHLFLQPTGQGRVVGAEVREEGRVRTQPCSLTSAPKKHT